MAKRAGASVKLTWLADLYHWHGESGLCVWVDTTYLLHLIDNTIFANKSSTHIHVTYLMYIDNLDACHEYAWGVVALTYLYDHLSYGSQYTSKQCGGYMTLLMSHICLCICLVLPIHSRQIMM
ncbi:Protein MAINTENANCE OF MERISTEMS [Glycine max]|nr:Protein MAINTENANCE OF MERISTEMS [Glycine max]